MHGESWGICAARRNSVRRGMTDFLSASSLSYALDIAGQRLMPEQLTLTNTLKARRLWRALSDHSSRFCEVRSIGRMSLLAAVLRSLMTRVILASSTWSGAPNPAFTTSSPTWPTAGGGLSRYHCRTRPLSFLNRMAQNQLRQLGEAELHRRQLNAPKRNATPKGASSRRRCDAQRRASEKSSSLRADHFRRR